MPIFDLSKIEGNLKEIYLLAHKTWENNPNTSFQEIPLNHLAALIDVYRSNIVLLEPWSVGRERMKEFPDFAENMPAKDDFDYQKVLQTLADLVESGAIEYEFEINVRMDTKRALLITVEDTENGTQIFRQGTQKQK